MKTYTHLFKGGTKCLFFLAALPFFSSCPYYDMVDEGSLEFYQSPRTVIVYMIADNNLDPFFVADINEMEEGWQEDMNGNLMVYVDRAAGASPAHPVVYKICHDTTSAIVSPIIKVYEEHNSADPRNMRRVLQDIILTYSSSSYDMLGLILWSHGTAWLPPGTSMNKLSRPAQQSFGKDGDDEMSIFDLKRALAAYHFDFIIFDACYMGSIEVAYELRRQTDYIISSPTEILSGGYPYAQIVSQLFKPTVNCSKIADTFFQSYATLEGALQSASVSVLETACFDALVDKVYQTMIDSSNLQYVNTESIQQLSTAENAALFDLGSFMAAVSTDEAHYSKFNKVLLQAIDYKASTVRILDNLQINDFSGMSIFVPNESNKQYHDFYKEFEWYQNTSYSKYFDKFIRND